MFQIDLQDGVSDGLEHEPHVLRVCKQKVTAAMQCGHMAASADLWRWCGGCRSSSGASAGAG